MLRIQLAIAAIGCAVLADTPSALAYVLDRYAVCAHTARVVEEFTTNNKGASFVHRRKHRRIFIEK